MSTAELDVSDDRARAFEQSLIDLRFKLGGVVTSSSLATRTNGFQEELDRIRFDFNQLMDAKDQNGNNLLAPATITRLSTMLGDLAEEYEDVRFVRPGD